MEFGLNISLRQSLQFPIRVRVLGGLPKIIAGGVPVTPINLVLKQRQRQLGATSASLDTYVRAARLYVEFCAYRGQSLLGVTNEEFYWFKHALLGHPFPDLSGMYVRLSGERKERTADLMIVLLYSLATDIADRYDISFDWLRYKGGGWPAFQRGCPAQVPGSHLSSSIPPPACTPPQVYIIEGRRIAR